jgi:hypothetical protein
MATMMKSLTPSHCAFLFYHCRSIKRMMTKSSAPHRCVSFFVLVL